MNEGKQKPTLLDLFSGIGGFSIGFEQEGFQTIGFSETDLYASCILKRHWPHVINYGDIQKYREWPDISPNVITGGFPCQPFSQAGQRRGKKDDRFLWPAMLGVIERYKPDWVIGENVPGIIGMELDQCCVDLENIGYSVQPIIIPACAVDAKHRRDRVWILAYSMQCGRSSQLGEQQKKWPQKFAGGCTHDANAQGERRQRINRTGNLCANGQPRKFCEGVSDNNGFRGREFTRGIYWPSEPRVGRVAHGIPNRSYRVKSLGNTIVPQIAQILASFVHKISYE